MIQNGLCNVSDASRTSVINSWNTFHPHYGDSPIAYVCRIRATPFCSLYAQDFPVFVPSIRATKIGGLLYSQSACI